MPIRGRQVVALAVAIALLCLAGTAALAGSTAPPASCWKGKTVNGAVRYCGPATARISVFRGITFKNGTCHKTRVNGQSALFLKLGARSLNQPLEMGGTNSGLAYFDLSVIGTLAHPRGGGVIAFFKGKYWYGRGTSFRATATGGTFVARGISARGSHGTATGSFQC